MKKLFFLILFSVSLPIFAQGNAAAIKLGSFSPGATDAGFIIGYEGGKYIDQNFNFGWSIDWFHKNYVDKTLVESFNEIYGISGGINELRAQTNLHDIPLMINATLKFPVAPRTKIYVTGAIGAEILIVDYRNFENPNDNELKGPSILIGGWGLAVHTLSDRVLKFYLK